MQKKNNDGKIVLILVIALIAFAIGAAIGINISLNGLNSTDDNVTHEINVTNQMIRNYDNASSSGSTNDVSVQEVNYIKGSESNYYT